MGVFHVFLIVQMAPNHATHQIWPNEISLKNMAFLEIISPSHNTKNQTNLMNSFISSEKKNRKDRQRQRDESKTIGPNIKSGHPITKNKHVYYEIFYHRISSGYLNIFHLDHHNFSTNAAILNLNFKCWF